MSFLFFFFPKTTCSLLRPGLHTWNSRAQHNLYICTCCTVHHFLHLTVFFHGAPLHLFLLLDPPTANGTENTERPETWFTIFHAVLALGTQSMTQMRRTTSALTSILRNNLHLCHRHSFRVDFSPQDEGILHQQVDDVVEESQQVAILRQLYVAAICICWQ